MEVYHMLFERCHSKNRKRFIKQHIKYFNFRSKVQLNHPVKSENMAKTQVHVFEKRHRSNIIDCEEREREEVPRRIITR